MLSLPASMPMRVNTTTTGSQLLSEAAGSSNGTAVVAWLHVEKNSTQIQAQRLDAQGQPVGGQITVAATGVSPGEGPHVALDGRGDWVVVWLTTRGIVGQRFGADGQRLGTTFTVARTAGNPSASVAMDRAGDFVVAYTDNHGNLQAQLYRADGQLQRSVLVARSRNMEEEWVGNVAMSPSGRFDVGADDSVTFADAPQMSSDSLWVYRFSAKGAALGGTRVLHSAVDNEGYNDVQTAIDAAGNGAIAFTQGNGTITIERVSAGGKRLGQNGVSPGANILPMVNGVALAPTGGQVVVAWEGVGGGMGVLAEVDSHGTTTGRQTLAGASALGLATVGQAAFVVSYSALDPSVADNPKGFQIFAESGTY